MSVTHSLPLRAVFRVWRELTLPDDFEDSVVEGHPHLFRLVSDPAKPNTHILHLIADQATEDFTLAVEGPPGQVRLQTAVSAGVQAGQGISEEG
uniref:PORR domain-containing protein n=1 Tax=Zea mays TaxID=4577 RepID=A0A804PRA3_MAIZE